jgi:hypothetical protein
VAAAEQVGMLGERGDEEWAEGDGSELERGESVQRERERRKNIK